MRTTSIRQWWSARSWSHKALAAVTPLGVLLVAVFTMAASSAGPPNAEAQRLRDAELVLRTNQWIEQRDLDRNSSSDMTRALEIGCGESKHRGDPC